MAQFARWYEEACAANLPQPHAMSLATATQDCRVSSWLVLLRSFDEAGFVFFTGLETQKVSEMRAKWAEVKKKFQAGEVPLPTGWGGYRVQPWRVEFWQGHADGLHDRFSYQR